MPYDPNHPVFTLPDSGDQTIWRYMDLAKFVSLLKDRALYLSRADLLGDAFEGSTTRPVSEARISQYTQQGNPGFAESWSKALKDTRLYTYVNCWHMSPYESAAMWSLYAGQGLGVAIQSTIPRLVETLTTQMADVKEQVHVGAVQYVDYNNAWIPQNNALWAYVHKRKSFEHEKELRVISMIMPEVEVGEDIASKATARGYNAVIDPEFLIEQLYVAPGSGEWFREVVRATAERFGLDRQVHESSLDGSPVF